MSDRAFQTLKVVTAMTKNKDGRKKKTPFFHTLLDNIYIPDSKQDHARPILVFSNNDRKTTLSVICLTDGLLLDDGVTKQKIKFGAMT